MYSDKILVIRSTGSLIGPARETLKAGYPGVIAPPRHFADLQLALY